MASERRPEKPQRGIDRVGRRCVCTLARSDSLLSSGGDTRDVHPLQPVLQLHTITTLKT